MLDIFARIEQLINDMPFFYYIFCFLLSGNFLTLDATSLLLIYALYMDIEENFVILARQLSVGRGWGKYLTGHCGFSLSNLPID